jgi:hypothetical protein
VVVREKMTDVTKAKIQAYRYALLNSDFTLDPVGACVVGGRAL